MKSMKRHKKRSGCGEYREMTGIDWIIAFSIYFGFIGWLCFSWLVFGY